MENLFRGNIVQEIFRSENSFEEMKYGTLLQHIFNLYDKLNSTFSFNAP